VVRLVPQSRAVPLAPIPKAAGLRVLLLSASPLGLDAIPWNDVRDGLIRVFRAALPTIEIVADDQTPAASTYLRIVEAATRKSVEQWISTDDPHVVHFVGHGTDRGLALINSKKNDPTLITAAAFEAALQHANSRRLVILSACDTANHASLTPVDATIGTFAEQIVRNAVPAVIANQTVIDKRTIATFCEGLYPELLKSGSIDVAVAAGRCSVASELDTVDSAAIEWGIPVLYRRLGAGQLFA
jgi:CHAT domain-containing protein